VAQETDLHRGPPECNSCPLERRELFLIVREALVEGGVIPDRRAPTWLPPSAEDSAAPDREADSEDLGEATAVIVGVGLSEQRARQLAEGLQTIGLCANDWISCERVVRELRLAWDKVALDVHSTRGRVLETSSREIALTLAQPINAAAGPDAAAIYTAVVFKIMDRIDPDADVPDTFTMVMSAYGLHPRATTSEQAAVWKSLGEDAAEKRRLEEELHQLREFVSRTSHEPRVSKPRARTPAEGTGPSPSRGARFTATRPDADGERQSAQPQP
jgi:hypothetical protein